MSLESTIAQHVTHYQEQLKSQGLLLLTFQIENVFRDEHCKEVLWSIPNFHHVIHHRWGTLLGAKLEYSDTASFDLFDIEDEELIISDEQQALLRDMFRRMSTMWNGYVFEEGWYHETNEGIQEIVMGHPKHQLLKFSDLDSWKQGIQAWIDSRTEEDASNHFNELLDNPIHRLAWYLAIRFYHGRSTFLTDLYTQERFALESWDVDGQTEICKALWEKAIAHFEFTIEPTGILPLRIGEEVEWVKSIFSGLSIEESRERYIQSLSEIEQAQKMFNCRWIVRYFPTVSYYEPKGEWIDWDKASADFCVERIDFYDDNHLLLGTFIEDLHGSNDVYMGTTYIPTGSMMNGGPQKVYLSYSDSEIEDILNDHSLALVDERSVAQLERLVNNPAYHKMFTLLRDRRLEYSLQGVQLLLALIEEDASLLDTVYAWSQIGTVGSSDDEWITAAHRAFALDSSAYDDLIRGLRELAPSDHPIHVD